MEKKRNKKDIFKEKLKKYNKENAERQSIESKKADAKSHGRGSVNENKDRRKSVHGTKSNQRGSVYGNREIKTAYEATTYQKGSPYEKRDHRNTNIIEANKRTSIINKTDNKTSKPCFLCFCCQGENDKANELILEERRNEELKRIQEERKIIENERKRREEKIERDRREKEERDRREKEERDRREKEERDRREKEEKEKNEMLRLLEEEKEKQKDEVLIKEQKPKLLPKKKQIINFIGAASAPNPPHESSCVGNPPHVKETSVPLKEGIYLIYNPENEGQLELHYTKTGKKGPGVLACIHSKSIPNFYFEKNHGKEILFKGVSKKMQSAYINDLKPYYECYIEFIKMKKKFNGNLYFLPASDAHPPPELDIVFFDSKSKKLNHVPMEKPVKFTGDYLLVIQKGLKIFQGEINTESILSYLSSYGALLDI